MATFGNVEDARDAAQATIPKLGHGMFRDVYRGVRDPNFIYKVARDGTGADNIEEARCSYFARAAGVPGIAKTGLIKVRFGEWVAVQEFLPVAGSYKDLHIQANSDRIDMWNAFGFTDTHEGNWRSTVGGLIIMIDLQMFGWPPRNSQASSADVDIIEPIDDADLNSVLPEFPIPLKISGRLTNNSVPQNSSPSRPVWSTPPTSSPTHSSWIGSCHCSECDPIVVIFRKP